MHGHDLAEVSAAFRSYGFEHTLTLENMEGDFGDIMDGAVRCLVIWLNSHMTG